MTRSKLSILLFFFLIIYMLFSVNRLHKITYELNELNDKALEFIENEDWKSAGKEAEKLLNLWEDSSKPMFISVNTNELTYISTEIVKLNNFTDLEQKDQAILCINVIKHAINQLSSLERVTFHNIF